MARETILVIDDDDDIREIVSMYLEDENYNVLTAKNGHEGLSLAFSENPDLIILDMVMPDLDGIEVCQHMRKKTSSPIIFLSSKSTTTNIYTALMVGGDDYICKPFDSLELIARVKAHLRRNRIIEKTNTQDNQNNLISYLNLTIDIAHFRVTLDRKEVILSPKEFQLLALLAQNPNIIFSSEELFQSLWGAESLGNYSTIMVHISNIRKKLEQEPKNPTFIHTIKGMGYKFSIK